ncbi:helix-turn-helix domain-containing protein [Mammaliicoccus fleurettii]|uniref:helix-turn-helix domain-containing protein n=1 Tax=Mammaliicoccus fleurettii TaxID=150056 RepID=UPI002DB9D8D6|nr:helix-turn-helix domain-containing protein [Mammaliicoccus fleurettii]MEB8067477.1 helix-turn-helix domain-containing protein [Mammaliicoccus fleurettii]
MPKTKLQHLPTRDNVITDDVKVITKPLYATPKRIGELFGISRSTVSRILNQYDLNNQGVEDLYFSLSATLTVVDIDAFRKYLKARNKKHL